MKKCLMHVFMASLWLVGCIQDDGWLGITGASEDVDDVEIVLPEKVQVCQQRYADRADVP